MDLPEEDGGDGARGLLRDALYGTRDAAQNWQNEYTEMLAEAGFRQGVSSARVFYNEQQNARIVAHGDDFTVLGPTEGLDWFRRATQNLMEVKFKARLERTPSHIRHECECDGKCFGVRGGPEARINHSARARAEGGQ